MKYELLSQKNPKYNGKAWEELEDFYQGGFRLYEKAGKYLPKQHNESDGRYQERLRMSSYIGYLSQVCDYFTANLFSQELSVHSAADKDDPDTIGDTPLPDHFWEVFSHDADRCGTPFARLMRGIFTTAILKKKAIVAVDFPSDEEVDRSNIQSRADEDAIGGARAFIVEIPVEHLLDWEYDNDGNFDWCITCETKFERKDISQKRDTCYYEFKHYHKVDKDDPSQTINIDVYRTQPFKLGEHPSLDQEVPVYKTIPTKFKRVPLLEVTVPEGLWIGNKIGLLAKEHFQRRSALNAAENKSLFSIPVVKLGPEMSAPGDAVPSTAQQNPNRGEDPVQKFKAAGFLVIGKDDDMFFAEPAGGAYEMVERQLEKLVDEMFRVVHQMSASVTQTKVGLYRSAASKQQDRLTTEVVLTEYGSIVKDFSKRIYDTIAEARGENVIWQAIGLDKYDLEDRTTILQEAIQMASIVIPSPTFRKVYMSRVADSLVGDINPETTKVIREEIQNAVDNDEDVLGLMAERPDPALVAPPVQAGTGAPGGGASAKAAAMGGGGGGGGSASAGSVDKSVKTVKRIPRRGPGGRVMGSISVK